MASLDLIREFQNKNKVEIDGENIKLNVERFLTLYQDRKTREEKIKTFAKGLYPKIAKEFELTKMNSVHYHSSEPITTTSLEFFEGYMNIMSELVKEASDHLIELSKEDAEKAKNAVQKAQKLYNDAKKEHDDAVTNFNINHPNNDQDINDNIAYKPLKKNYDVAKMNLDNMIEKEKSLVAAVPYESTKKYFGMTLAEAKSLIEEQISSCNYMDERRTQMETVGVRFDGFMNELNNAFKDKDITYQNATAEQKRGMQEVYATKKLMNEQLQSKTGSGIFSWFWRIWYRKDISAINNYINAANQALSKANFAEPEEKEADDAMTKQGYFYNEYKASNAEAFLNEQLAENTVDKNKKVNASDLEKEAKLREIDANRDKDIAAAAEKDAISQMFAVRFRPPVTTEDLNAQVKIGNQVSKEFVHGNTSLDSKAKAVFNANMNKLIAMKQHLGKYANPKLNRSKEEIQNNFNQMIEQFEQAEREFIYQNPKYVPVTIEDIQKAMTKRESLADTVVEDVKDNVKNIEVSQPVVNDAPVVKNDEVIKS